MLPLVCHQWPLSLLCHPLYLTRWGILKIWRKRNAFAYTYGCKENVGTSLESGFSVSCCSEPLLSSVAGDMQVTWGKVVYIWVCFLPSGPMASGLLLNLAILSHTFWPSNPWLSALLSSSYLGLAGTLGKDRQVTTGNLFPLCTCSPCGYAHDSPHSDSRCSAEPFCLFSLRPKHTNKQTQKPKQTTNLSSFAW